MIVLDASLYNHIQFLWKYIKSDDRDEKSFRGNINSHRVKYQMSV